MDRERRAGMEGNQGCWQTLAGWRYSKLAFVNEPGVREGDSAGTLVYRDWWELSELPHLQA